MLIHVPMILLVGSLSLGDAEVVDTASLDVDAAIRHYEDARANGADEFEVSWRIARAWCRAGEVADSSELKTVATQGMEAGQRAADLAPDRVEGHFFYACNVGTYAQAVGILKAIEKGLEGKFRKAADAAMRIDADYDDGGPRNALARFHYSLPWPKRKLNKSRDLLETNVSKFPDSARARFYLAETLVALGEEEQAQAQLLHATESNQQRWDSGLFRERASVLYVELKGGDR